MAKVLLTGGAGFIGSHTACVLIARGHEIVLLDDFSNAARDVPDRLRQITGARVPVIEADLRDASAVLAALTTSRVDAVVHFAARKSISEGEADPLLYFDVNIAGTLNLLKAMGAVGCGRIVFSSSATVYGDPETCPITEAAPLRVTNVYGRTKVVMEGMIGDLGRSGVIEAAAILRYFNPVGAHPSGLIGEDPHGVPANLMPYLCQVAEGQRPYLTIFGNDYPTHDGTGVRDFIHVMDLAEAHVAAVDRVLETDGAFTVNLGTGVGYSVLDMVAAFQAATGIAVPYQIGPRRPGDIAACYADPAYAAELLGWRATRTLRDMCHDAWSWQSKGVAAPQ